MILNEVIRLYPPAVNISLSHDTSLWGEDANKFKPERFSGGISKVAKDESTAFIPFGYGLRSCVGQNYAMLETKVVLAMILQRFSLVLSPGYVHAPTSLLTIYPQHVAPIIFPSLQCDENTVCNT
ncbi:hypothetical protein SUGI_0467280 [Cryptomeria japonica]|nr:hypothetical protein SUGI_0467280 [Cryptomeria japonica]